MKRNIACCPYPDDRDTWAVRFASALDATSIVVVPPREFFDSMQEEKGGNTCVFYHPRAQRFVEERGMKVRLHNAFPNIRVYRNLAWIGADFTRALFARLEEEQLTMKVLYRTASTAEFIVWMYTTNVEAVLEFSPLYESEEAARLYEATVRSEKEATGRVCINNILEMYSNHVVELGRAMAADDSAFFPSSPDS